MGILSHILGLGPTCESFLTDLSKKHEWVKKSLDSFYSLRELRF